MAPDTLGGREYRPELGPVNTKRPLPFAPTDPVKRRRVDDDDESDDLVVVECRQLLTRERGAVLADETIRRSSLGVPRGIQGSAREMPRPRLGDVEVGSASSIALPTVAIPNRPVSLLPHSKPSTLERDDGGPFKSEMVRRMDNMWKGDRVVPPCDRCRRLHMDCLKHLTACMSCTKQHAKCSWREVKKSELHTASFPKPENEGAPMAGHLGSGAPHPRGSLFFGAADIAMAPLNATGDKLEIFGSVQDRATRRKVESALGTSPSARFDIRFIFFHLRRNNEDDDDDDDDDDEDEGERTLSPFVYLHIPRISPNL
ncbi:hypothetical protein LTR41_011389 [Exophiala xenobiotica]|nr:hypothetical protein LTR41_011389 [Exophiala xenobiotica]KAK5550506.1 hypothetical protein LTR46_011486 [Exophiala xenobiotica]